MTKGKISSVIEDKISYLGYLGYVFLIALAPLLFIFRRPFSG